VEAIYRRAWDVRLRKAIPNGDSFFLFQVLARASSCIHNLYLHPSQLPTCSGTLAGEGGSKARMVVILFMAGISKMIPV
jgi:hypothetical protein